MSTTKKKRTRFVIGIMLLFALCLFFMFHMVGKTKQLRSDSAGVEFVTEGEVVTCLNVRGTFPYTSIVPKLAEERKTDSNGNITETYFERLEDATYTYILKFADKDIIISNGKVVE